MRHLCFCQIWAPLIANIIEIWIGLMILSLISFIFGHFSRLIWKHPALPISVLSEFIFKYQRLIESASLDFIKLISSKYIMQLFSSNSSIHVSQSYYLIQGILFLCSIILWKIISKLVIYKYISLIIHLRKTKAFGKIDRG